MKIRLFLLGLSVLFIVCDHDKIQNTNDEDDEPFWKQTVFDSTHITTLAAHPSGSVFAANVGFDSGVFRSVDDGDNWDRLDGVLTNDYVRVMAIKPDGIIFAGTYDGLTSRIITSTDHGETWTERALPRSLYLQDITVNSSDDIFISSLESDETSAGIFRSTDNGQNWTQIDIPTGSARDLESTLEGNIYAATFRGVYRSTDNGHSWLQLNEGLSDTLVLKLASDGHGTLYASTDQSGIFRSADSGTTWTQTGLVKPCIEVLMTHPNGDILAAVGWHAAVYNCTQPEGVYFSNDKGKTWQQLNDGLTDKKVTSLAITTSGFMFAGTTKGIFRSSKPATQLE